MAEPHVPEVLADDTDVVFPIASMEILWYLDEDGDDAFAYTVKGELRQTYAIGSLYRIMAELDREANGEEE